MKVQTALELDEELLEQLKKKAEAEKSSLDNYVESLLLQMVEGIPNTDTQRAIYEAENDINLVEIDNLDALKKSFLSDV